MTTKIDDDRHKQILHYFRRIVRTVILNRSWLVDSSDQKLTLNVKKNVALFVRQVRKVGILTLAEKALIRTPILLRSVNERKKLVHLLANMPCLSKLPPKVRARLAPVISFTVLGPDRVLLREGDPPSFLYFVLSGDLAISKRVYDPIQDIYIEKQGVVVGAGDWIGDTDMIEQTKRQITVTTLTESELLVVYSDDFDRILRPVMERQWFDKKRAMLSLGYFDMFDAKQISNGCRLGFLRQYEPLETIYYEDKGPLTFVHFVVSGECMILQCLRMKVTAKKGKEKKYELVSIKKGGAYDIFKELSAKELEKLIIEQARTEFSKTQKFDFDELSNSDESNQTSNKLAIRHMDTKDIQAECSKKAARSIVISRQSLKLHDNFYSNRGSMKSASRLSYSYEDDFDMMGEGGQERSRELFSDTDIETSSSNARRFSSTQRARSIFEINPIEKTEQETNDPEPQIEVHTQSYEQTQEEMAEEEEFTQAEENEQASSEKTFAKEDPDTKIENHFIDVGSLTFGGIFGLGETLEHRVIMARTTVQCFLIPRFWLFEKINNPAGIWNRRRFYLDSNIPSRETLFQNFLTTRKWQKFKHDLIESNVADSLKCNPTKVQDIPIICRIVEATDD